MNNRVIKFRAYLKAHKIVSDVTHIKFGGTDGGFVQVAIFPGVSIPFNGIELIPFTGLLDLLK